MPNLAGVVNSVRRIGRGSSFVVSIDKREVYFSRGMISEKRAEFEKCQRMLGERVVLIYDEVNIEFMSVDRAANFLSGVLGFGKLPKNYREARNIMLESSYLKEPLQDIFE